MYIVYLPIKSILYVAIHFHKGCINILVNQLLSPIYFLSLEQLETSNVQKEVVVEYELSKCYSLKVY